MGEREEELFIRVAGAYSTVCVCVERPSLLSCLSRAGIYISLASAQRFMLNKGENALICPSAARE